MFTITGTYNFRPRIVAFRADYCRSCQSNTIALAHRTLDVFHVFWIPVIPLGAWTRWYCRQCGNRPHDVTTIRKSIRLLVAVFFLLLSTLFWSLGILSMLDPLAPSPEKKGFLIGGLAMTALFVLSGIWASKTRSDHFKERIRNVQPFVGHTCPVCDGNLDVSRTLTCRECGADSRPLQ